MLQLRIIGKFTEKPEHILQMGGDGCFCEYDGETACIRLMDEDELWTVDVIENASIILDAASDVFSRSQRRSAG